MGSRLPGGAGVPPFGLMAGGESGVRRVLDPLREQSLRALAAARYDSVASAFSRAAFA